MPRKKFKEITEAYDVLRDPNKRALYDRYGEAGLREARADSITSISPRRSGIFMRDSAVAGIGLACERTITSRVAHERCWRLEDRRDGIPPRLRADLLRRIDR